MLVKILITSAAAGMSRQLASSLGDDHEVLLTDRDEVSTPFRFVRSDLNHTPPTNDLVRGVDVIVHSGAVDPSASVSDQLDHQMRCTYNLLWAASQERVPRFVYLSSLRLMEGYDPSFAVTERWKPTPTLEPPVLCCHLGEIVCREFARERKIEVTILRLGEITPAAETNPSTSGPVRGRRDRGGQTGPHRRSFRLARYISHPVGCPRRQVPDRPTVAERG